MTHSTIIKGRIFSHPNLSFYDSLKPIKTAYVFVPNIAWYGLKGLRIEFPNGPLEMLLSYGMLVMYDAPTVQPKVIRLDYPYKLRSQWQHTKRFLAKYPIADLETVPMEQFHRTLVNSLRQLVL